MGTALIYEGVCVLGADFPLFGQFFKIFFFFVRKPINFNKGGGGAAPFPPPLPGCAAGGWQEGTSGCQGRRDLSVSLGLRPSLAGEDGWKQQIPDSLCIPAGSWSRLELRRHQRGFLPLSILSGLLRNNGPTFLASAVSPRFPGLAQAPGDGLLPLPWVPMAWDRSCGIPAPRTPQGECCEGSELPEGPSEGFGVGWQSQNKCER